MEYPYIIESYRLLLIPFYSNKDPREIIELLKKRLGTKFTVINGNKAYSPKLILIAYIMARRSFKRGSNISRNLGIEMLLYLSGTRQIRDAIKDVGYNGGRGLIVAWEIEDPGDILNDVSSIVNVKDVTLEHIKPEDLLKEGYHKDVVKRYEKANLLELLAIEKVNLLEVED